VQFSLSVLDLAIVAGSLAIVVGVGFWAGRGEDKSARGYFLASGRMPWWIIGSAFVSTSVSSEQIVGTVGAAYQYGMGIANWEWCTLPVYTLLMVFFIPVYLKNRVATVSEFLHRRYGPVCADFYSCVMLFAYVFIFLVPVFYSGTLAISDLTGWPFQAVLWTMVAVVAAYTVKGGLASVMWTDAMQCLMLVGGGVLLFFVAIGKVPGGWNAMIAANPERFHLYRPAGDEAAPFLGLVAAMCGVILFYQAGNQVMIQRVLGARSEWDGYMGIIFAGFINFLRPLVTCFLGLIVYHCIHEMKMDKPLADKDLAFPFALRMLAPSWGLRGIVLAGFLAAVMSTLSALANSTATIFALDVYRKWIRPTAGENQTVFVGRLASLLALVVAALIAPSVGHLGGIFRYFQQGVTYLSTPFLSALFLGILWKRTNYQGGLFALFGGSIIQIAVIVGFTMAGCKLHWLYLAFFAQVLTMLGVVVVSLMFAPPPAERWEPFHWSPKLLLSLDAGAARPWYKSLKLWFAVYAIVWVYLYWRYW
jgi:solute:Na+ symporter, SSS family